MACGDFGKAFADNMSALGLPAPSGLFSTLQAATANVAAMLNAFRLVGKDATVAEMIGATTALEGLAVVGALSASYYVGACIGSLIVAADKAMVCTSGVQAAGSVRQWAVGAGLNVPQHLYAFIELHPEVISDRPGRGSYAYFARRMGVAA